MSGRSRISSAKWRWPGAAKGELAVGFGPHAAQLLLPHALPRFVSEHPTVRIRIQIDSIEVLGRALRQRSLDLVVGESTILESDESIDVFEPLEPIKGYLFVRAGHPLASSTVSLRDVLDYPLVQVSRLPPHTQARPRRAGRFLDVGAFAPRSRD